MFKYVLMGIALKALSCSELTRSLYRALGNTVGASRRATGRMPAYYFERLRKMLAFSQTYGFPKDGDRILELGTGWLHWEAITSSLFFDIEAVLVDVWDNRQLSGIKNYLCQLDQLLNQLNICAKKVRRAHQLIAEINKTQYFEDLYTLLGFTYLLDNGDKLSELKASSFDLVVSAGVLEHVHENSVDELISNIARILKLGGYSYHSINLRDHLSFYDPSASAKQYLSYSDRKWKRCFENNLQYFNRIQFPAWLEVFRNAGLVLIHKETQEVLLSDIEIAKDFEIYDHTILSCSGLIVVHQKAT